MASQIRGHLGRFRSEAGFSYLGVLLLTAVTGIALAGASHIWRTAVQRDLEAELLYRGDRIREAIGAYYGAGGEASGSAFPGRLEDLLKDPRFPGAKRHLRKVFADPFTGKPDWVLIRDPSGGIRGVHSRHAGTPMKKADFPKRYTAFEKAKTYQDWQFVFVPTS